MTVLLHINGQFIGGLLLTALVLYSAGFLTALYLLLFAGDKKEKKE